MPLNEADTRAKLIDPALRLCGWTEDLIFREQTAGSIASARRSGSDSRTGCASARLVLGFRLSL
jgi:type I site-specific restriction endonuclease